MWHRVVESQVKNGRVSVPAEAVELRARVRCVAETSRIGGVVEDDDQRRLMQARPQRLRLFEAILPHLQTQPDGYRCASESHDTRDTRLKEKRRTATYFSVPLMSGREPSATRREDGDRVVVVMEVDVACDGS